MTATASDVEINMCSICDTAVAGRRQLIHHFQSFHGFDASLFYKCEICCIVFPNRETMLKHSQEGHRVNQFICKICNNSYFLKDSLDHHILESHSTTAKSVSQQNHSTNSNSSTSKNSFQCDICHKVFKNKRSFSRHMKLELEKQKKIEDYVGIMDIENDMEVDYDATVADPLGEYVPCQDYQNEALYFQGYDEDNIECSDPLSFDTTNVNQFSTAVSRVNFEDYEVE